MSPSPAQLEATFQQIYTERMQGVPIINKKLTVKATEFQAWKDYQLGILITPWFMNIMLLPNNKTPDQKAINNTGKVGATKHHQLPSGTYTFVTGYEEAIGFFESCSLFSPMFHFTDQATAELTAKEALLALMNEENVDTASQNPSTQIEKIWAGEIPLPESAQPVNQIEITNTHHQQADKPLSERLKEPTSRRDFLRGAIFRDENS